MKAIKFANLCIVALALTVAAVGCKKKPTGVTNLPKDPRWSGVNDPSASAGDRAGVAPSGSKVEAGGGALPLGGTFEGMTQDRSALADYTIYFDFDSSIVRSSEQGKVAAVAGVLAEKPGDAVLIEGYCDERGTEGYNLSLGERRALAIREALVAAGVSGSRVDVISFGEENPADPAHDEIAWSKNRRGVFVLLLP